MTNTPAELPSELAALIDYGPIELAQSEIDQANARHRAAEDGVRAADRDLREARDALPRLLDAAVAGTAVSSATLARVHRRIEDATKFIDFQREVSRRLQPDPREAEQRMARARAEAYAALLARGVDLRIAAAARADRADGDVNRNTDHAERHAAKIDYEAASRIVHHAIRNGARFPGSVPQAMGLAMPSWPSTEYAERSYWNRPAPEGEMAA